MRLHRGHAVDNRQGGGDGSMTQEATQLVGSILFTDLVGFTEFNDVSGDDAALHVLDKQRKLIDAVLNRHPGSRLVKEIGDGLMVWSPSAPAALSSASEFAANIDAARETDAFPLAVRLGIHHGPVHERGDDLIGRTVNLAARIADLAGPSELLVSEEVLAACPAADRQNVEPVGSVTVKGVAAPVWLHRVAERGNRDRFADRSA
jgi:adenylate cyclase